MSKIEKKDLLKVKLKDGAFSDEEIAEIADKLKKGLKNKYGDESIKGGVNESGKIKFKAKSDVKDTATTVKWYS
ncbi:hypothetical protein Misp06_03617 [Microbulbifer sp. NBRC 101763]|uniref:hypothetical protein n=1 Tax=Microbulbifer sp. NBRC 101763 TaxID=1113820 RepID=UPI0030A9865A